jgi:hypothetical protein
MQRDTATPATGISEKEFMRQVAQLAKLRNWRVYHVHDSRRSAYGWPDLTLCRPPRIIFAELKRDDGVCTEAQLAWLEDLGKCFSVEVKLWRPYQWPEIVETLALPR